jgi:uncharacterized protein
MPLDILVRMMRDVLRSPGIKNVTYVWHGGEITLLPIEYLKKALWLQQKYVGPETKIINCIQTNATGLTKEWIQFLSAYGFSVGVSIDGPPEIHDGRRRTINGQGTWKDVLQGIESLKEARIPFGALAVVDQCVLTYGASRYLKYLSALGIRSVALLNVIPSSSPDQGKATRYLPWTEYVEFIRDLFSVWWNDYREQIEIRELSALVGAIERQGAPLCVFQDNCMGQYLTIEPNGDVSACEKYVGDPDFVYGNLLRGELNQMLSLSLNLKQAKADVGQQKQKMSSCRHYKYCFGGCPHDVRLTHKYMNDADEACCGLSLLIDDMQTAINGSRV